MGASESEEHLVDRRITRRGALRLGAGVAFLAASAGTLGACGGDAKTATVPEGKPRRGGTLTVGIITGGTAETLNPGLVLGSSDGLRTYQLFDRLFETRDDVKTMWPGLATSAEPNADASVWTLKLRDGVTWHDGKPFTADDVVWTFRTWSDPNSYANQFVSGIVDFKRVRKRDKLTVEVPLHTKIAQFPTLLTFYNMGVVQNGTTKSSFAQPVGTGPFKFRSFTPGRQSVFVANRDYWENPYPYVDELVIDSSFSDETPRLNALLAGDLDVLSIVPATIAKQYEHNDQFQLLRSPSPITMLLTMRVDQGPFADVRVRQALRLCADRQALVDNALNGFGTVANDLIGKGCEYFAEDLVRPHDVEQARALLKAAGREGMSFNLPTSNAVPGFVESATLFAQQAKAAGFNINVKNGPASSYFGNDFATRPIGQDQCLSAPSLTQHYRTFFAPGGAYNTTHWGSQAGGKQASALIDQAMAAVDPGKADELWREVQQQQFDQGGQLAWGSNDSLDLVATRVKGLKAGPGPTLNNWRLLTGWLA